jgi:hypothetical protein
LTELGATLRRVKAAERPTDDGGKKVWHQGDKGVEVLSFVSSAGRVTRQEIYVEGGLAIWSAGEALVTGKPLAEPPRIGIARSEQIIPDSEPQLEPLELALAVLAGAPTQDRYLSHLKAELQSAYDGLEAGLEKSVTTLRPRPSEPVEVTRSLTITGRVLPWLVGAGLAAAGVAAWWFSRQR